MNNEPNPVPATGECAELPALDLTDEQRATATRWVSIVEQQGGDFRAAYRAVKGQWLGRCAQLRAALSELTSVKRTNLMLQEEVRCGMIELERAEQRARERKGVDETARLMAERDRLREALNTLRAWSHDLDSLEVVDAALAPPADRVQWKAQYWDGSQDGEVGEWLDVEGANFTTETEGRHWEIDTQEEYARAGTRIVPADRVTAEEGR